MDTTITNAAGAYADALKRMGPSAAGTELSTAPANRLGAFGEMLAQQVNNIESTGKASEAAATQAAAGQGNLVDLVTQVAEAEVMLQTAVTVRDRVISAYQEIMRMPI